MEQIQLTLYIHLTYRLRIEVNPLSWHLVPLLISQGLPAKKKDPVVISRKEMNEAGLLWPPYNYADGSVFHRLHLVPVTIKALCFIIHFSRWQKSAYGKKFKRGHGQN